MSNVRKSERGLSKLEFINNANKIRTFIAVLSSQNLGLKKKSKKLMTELKRYKLDDSDIQELVNHFHDKGIDINDVDVKVLYDESTLEHYKKRLLLLGDKLVECLLHANTLMPNIREEYTKRRLLQDEAIFYCIMIMNDVAFLQKMYNTKYFQYSQLLSALEEEIKLIKGWRKSDYSRFKNLLIKEEAIDEVIDDQIKEEYKKFLYQLVSMMVKSNKKGYEVNSIEVDPKDFKMYCDKLIEIEQNFNDLKPIHESLKKAFYDSYKKEDNRLFEKIANDLINKM